ncbi:MAG: hypothetical protein M3P49_15025 [Actinomycetota bacterium]|nr:hypothetical protein [Actinomycetota bacterium]
MNEENTGRPRPQWPREGRIRSAVPRPIPPHPDFEGRPPCESGISSSRPCKRDAAILFNGMYVCDEHFGWMNASEEHGEAEMAVFHAKRMLWRSRVEDVPRLEHHLTGALGELEQEEREAAKLERDAYATAEGGDDV